MCALVRYVSMTGTVDTMRVDLFTIGAVVNSENCLKLGLDLDCCLKCMTSVCKLSCIWTNDDCELNFLDSLLRELFINSASDSYIFSFNSSMLESVCSNGCTKVLYPLSIYFTLLFNSDFVLDLPVDLYDIKY